MPETPISLLERLRLRPDDEAWKQLVDLYAPLMQGWLRGYFLQPADADDVVQEVFQVVVSKMPEFRHNRQTGAFRHWLRTILHRCLAESRQASRAVDAGNDNLRNLLNQFQDPNSDLSRRWDEEHNRHVAHYFLQRVQGRFEPTTWQAFFGVVMEGKRPAVVAAELGVTANAVRLAKSHVLHWLREISKGLID